jgi:ribosomal protein L7Ae-like RNA K-turn-binding protein
MKTSRRSGPADGLALLGLAQRAGAVSRGTEATRRAIRKGEARLVVVADDASRVQLDKIDKANRSRGLRTVTVPTRAQLGAALGAGPLSAVAVTQASFARQVANTLAEQDAAENHD